MNKPVILCVDDEKIVIDSLRAQLQHRFADLYSIEVAQSAEEALELCDELIESATEIPLVIVDYVMPGMYGDKLLEKLKQKLPESLSIMLTGQATAEAVGAALNKAGLFRYIGKPWEEDDLLLTVDTALQSFLQKKKIARQQCHNNLLSNVIALALQPAPLEEQLNRALNNFSSVLELKNRPAAIYLLDKNSKLTLTSQFTENACTFAPQIPADPSDREKDPLQENNLQELPIYYQDTLLGIVAISTLEESEHHQELMELLYSFCDALAGIISLKQYQQQLEQHNAELEKKVAQRTSDLESALQKQAQLNDILLDANGKLDFFASMDGLTAVYNRRFFMKLANSELERAKRYAHPAAFIMLDLDHFKDINDQFGHMAGDYVLEHVATILKSECREVDLVGRLGGEEFAIVSPESNLEQAKQLAERIRRTIKNTRFNYKGNIIEITTSIGITEVNKEDSDIGQAMNRADFALYKSKGTGRNLVTIASPAN